ncbi:MAG: outer membrane beta-barrel protein [Opitutus sp.]
MKKILTLILLLTAGSAFAGNPYVGTSAGYLIDGEEPLFTARVGSEIAQSNGLLHSIEAEIGYASEKESGVKLEIIPVMANYRLRGTLGHSEVNFYSGAGAGFSRQKLTGFGFGDDAWAFALQVFGGMEIKVAPSTSLTVGARYLWINKYTIANVGVGSSDDVALEVGIHFRL